MEWWNDGVVESYYSNLDKNSWNFNKIKIFNSPEYFRGLFLAVNRNKQLSSPAIIPEFTQVNPLPGTHVQPTICNWNSN